MDILEKIKLNPINPRDINEGKFETLKSSIKEFSKMLELRPIVVNKDGKILGGNMRYRALQAEGIKLKKEWVKVADKLTPEEERRFVIEDNMDMGHWDWDILGNEWSDLPLEEWGLPMGNWSEDINEEWDGMPEFGEKPIFNAYKSLNVHFDDQESVDKFAELVGQKITEKTKSIWYPKKEKEDIKSLRVKNEV